MRMAVVAAGEPVLVVVDMLAAPVHPEPEAGARAVTWVRAEHAVTSFPREHRVAQPAWSCGVFFLWQFYGFDVRDGAVPDVFRRAVDAVDLRLPPEVPHTLPPWVSSIAP